LNRSMILNKFSRQAPRDKRTFSTYVPEGAGRMRRGLALDHFLETAIESREGRDIAVPRFQGGGVSIFEVLQGVEDMVLEGLCVAFFGHRGRDRVRAAEEEDAVRRGPKV